MISRTHGFWRGKQPWLSAVQLYLWSSFSTSNGWKVHHDPNQGGENVPETNGTTPPEKWGIPKKERLVFSTIDFQRRAVRKCRFGVCLLLSCFLKDVPEYLNYACAISKPFFQRFCTQKLMLPKKYWDSEKPYLDVREWLVNGL